MDRHEFSNDRNSVTITNEHGSTTYTLEQLELVIAFLGTIRGQMKPAVPVATPDPQLGKYLPLQDIAVLPVLRDGETAPSRNGALLVARSESFGWFDYPMTAEFCQGLLSWLAAQPEAILPPPGTTLN